MKQLLVCILATLLLAACKKSAFLAATPNASLVVPASIQDFQAILDNDNIMNGSSRLDGLTSGFAEVGCDDYYGLEDIINSFGASYVNLYTWNDDIYPEVFTDWDFGYRAVFYANEVLDGLPSTVAGAGELKGSALFYRAHVFYHLAQVFAPPYDSATAGKDWGLPLRLSSDINEPIQRATVKETYDRIIADLQASLPLLPETPLYKTRPSKPAAYGLLAKVYLSMRDYNKALLYADSCLQQQPGLLDFNTIYSTANNADYPFQRFNDEVVFHAVMNEIPLSGIGLGRADSLLYRSYDDNDLRKALFFTDWGDGKVFRGSYDHTNVPFTGISADEMYLIRAEGYARQGNTAAAFRDLNTLLKTRWKTGTFVPLATGDALQTILAERRKELIFRGCRFTDLRRLNKEGANITQHRTINGQVYTLPPNSMHYTYLIPPEIISFNPGMPQNPR